MIKATDSIEGSGHPLAFRLSSAGQRAPLFGTQTGSAVLTVEARAMGGHQKEAVVTEGKNGPVWRLVSDEGPVLGGSDLAPAPLSFFCAGLQADLMGRMRALSRHHDVPIDALSTTVENHFAFTGSFVSGTGQGATQPALMAIAVHTAAPWERVSHLVRAAVQASPAIAGLRHPLANTFALYVNGRRSAVHGVHASRAPDATDPYVAHAGRPAPQPGTASAEALIRRLKDSDVKPGVLPASGGNASIVVHGQGQALIAEDAMDVETRLLKPPGSSFRLRTDERAAGEKAPSGLAMLSAGISFCYLTQLLRYVQHRKYDVRAIRLVQHNPYALEDSAGRHALLGRAGPVDTHLFLHGTAPDDIMQELLLYSARTCFLHAALGSAFEPLVTLSLNGGQSAPVALSP
jgi:hypothetical protein